ncbi:uncharacterized protein [Ptychodera flava]|uniref:uncharacterized protein n=1 Tax=Ptychodera flava TaxID=63121 RepID=UPI003969E388
MYNYVALNKVQLYFSAITLSALTISDPPDYSITTFDTVELTYSVTLTNSVDNEDTVSTINVYLSDDNAMTTTSDPFDTTGDFPITVPASSSGGGVVTENDLKTKVIADVSQCSDYTYICAKELTSDTHDCVLISASGGIDCSNIGVADDTFKITSPADYTITTTTEVTLTYDIKLENSGGDLDIDVTGINLYLADDNDMTTKSAPFESIGNFPIKVGANDDNEVSGLTATVIADAEQCLLYKKICVQVLPNEDTQCLASDDIDCSVVSVEEKSFVITSPSPSDITYTTYKDTEITFDLQVTATVDEASVTGVNVYFTNDIDSEERVKSDPVLATGGAPTPEEPKPIDHQASEPTDIPNCEAKLKLDDDNCADYTLLCISLSADGGVEGEECIPLGEEENQGGTPDCSEESGSAKLGIHALEMFTSLLVVLVVQRI